MKNELNIFFTALMFYSRLPVPQSTEYSFINLNQSIRYFPLVGIIIASLGALIFMLIQSVLPIHIAVFTCLTSMIFITGAFHEDGLADFCDGFGGGYDKKQILNIMKDSRIGTYGSIVLITLLIFKFLLLSEFSIEMIPVILISAHAFSRVLPVLLIFTSQYVSEDNDAKSKHIGKKHSKSTLIIAILIGCLPLLWTQFIFIPFLFLGNLLIFLYFRHYVHQKIGGYTGDVLGALQQISEVSFYFIYLIVLSFVPN